MQRISQRPAELWRSADLILTKIMLLFISFCLGINFARLIKQPFSNPYDISSAYASDHFMPANNYLLLIFTVLFTIGFYVGFSWLIRKWPTYTRLGIVGILALMVFTGLIAPEHSRYLGNIDVFHHGEQLSPGSALYSGKHLYSQIFFLHGAGEDAALPALAFHLFGRTIGSYFFLTGVLQAVSALLFLFMLHRLIKQHSLFLLAALWFLGSFYSSFYYVRDIFVWASLLLVYEFVVREHGERVRLALLGALGLLCGAAFFYSVDRGLFLLVLNGLIGVFLLGFTAEGESYRPQITGSWQPKLKRVGVLAGGFLLTMLVGLTVLGTTAFGSFLNITFYALPKFEGLMFNNPFPSFSDNSWLTWMPVVLVILLVLAVAKTTLWTTKSFSRELIFALTLIIFGIVFLQAAAGMADAPHMAYATPALFVAAFYTLSMVISKVKTDPTTLHLAKVWPLMLAIILMFTPSVFNLFRLPEINQVSFKYAKEFRHLPTMGDNAWLPQQVKDTKDYIAAHTKANDPVFVFTSQPIYYYLINRPNPSRFYTTWFADPKPYTLELLNDLQKNPPKYIIYQTGSYYDRPDFIPMSERIPEVDSWIQHNYPNTITIDNTINIKTR